MTTNNLNFVRLFGASLVLYGHSFVFLGLPEPLFLSLQPLGALGVLIFFTISGYLITESWDRDPNLSRFIARRMLRIFPALVVCTLLSILVLGPALTTRDYASYFSDARTWQYLRNILLYIVYYLPGVFETNRVPNAVNGSLWSIPIEVLMYVMVMLIGVLGNRRWGFALLALGSAAVSFFWAARAPEVVVVYGSDMRQVFICGTYFWLGAVFYKFDLKRYFTLPLLVLAFTALLCLEPWPGLLTIGAWVLLPTIVLAFGLSHSPSLSRLMRQGDYSYGIYIYAFPIQQTMVTYFPQMPIVSYLIACFGLTLACAVVSWHLIEQPSLALKPRRR